MLSTTEFKRALAFEYGSSLVACVGDPGGWVWGGGLAIYIFQN